MTIDSKIESPATQITQSAEYRSVALDTVALLRNIAGKGALSNVTDETLKTGVDRAMSDLVVTSKDMFPTPFGGNSDQFALRAKGLTALPSGVMRESDEAKSIRRLIVVGYNAMAEIAYAQAGVKEGSMNPRYLDNRAGLKMNEVFGDLAIRQNKGVDYVQNAQGAGILTVIGMMLNSQLSALI